MRTPEEPRTPQTPAPPWTPCAPLAFGLSKALLRGSPGSGTRDARTTTPADHRRRELAKITNLSQNLKYLAASSAACLPRTFIEYSQSSAAIYFFLSFPKSIYTYTHKAQHTHPNLLCNWHALSRAYSRHAYSDLAYHRSSTGAGAVPGRVVRTSLE